VRAVTYIPALLAIYRTFQRRSEEMKKIIVLIAVLLSCLNLPLASQPLEQEYSHHAMYMEIGGQGVLYTLNYDYRFAKFFAARVGFTHYTIPNFFFSDLTVTAFPIMGEFLVGGKEHFFEIGLGIMPTIGESSFHFFSSSKSAVVGTANIGYRYQPSDEGLLFRASLPIFVTSTGVGAWGGVSFGYAF
jgi:hypothetical protein